MGRHYQILIPLLSLFLVRVDLTDLWPLEIQVEITKILDGDTVEIRYGNHLERLRFSRIDAPEMGQPFLGSHEDAGAASRLCVKNILKKKFYKLQIEKRDMYGRMLGDLENLSLKFVEEGCVSLYPYAIFSDQKEKYTYIKALQKARALKRGLWKYGGYRQPKLWRKNKSSKRISHRPSHRRDRSQKPYRPEQKL